MSRYDKPEKIKLRRSYFNLSKEVKLTCDMGELVPVYTREVVPGDKFFMESRVVVRLAPMVAPMFADIDICIDYWFVPYRLLMPEPNGWETFLTGGVDGTATPALPYYSGPVTDGSLADYLGYNVVSGNIPAASKVVAFPFRAYALIWNTWYRDHDLQTALDITTNTTLQNVLWKRDFFTTGALTPQRGVAPALPITGTGSAVWGSPTGTSLNTMQYSGTDNHPNAGTKTALELNTVAFGSAVTFGANDIRYTFAVQKLMERAMRGGSEYIEWLEMMHGVHPKDERLQRAEFIGGFKTKMIVSEVLQTSASVAGQTPQGTMAGHGLAADKQQAANVFVQEHGIIMGLLYIRPRAEYQQGISRQWLKDTRYDVFNPVFIGLGEQDIRRMELYATNVDDDNRTVFAYQGRYDEMRQDFSSVHGLFKTTLNYWHMGRIFASPPALNSAFVSCVPSKRVFAEQSQDECYVHIGHKVHAVRPLPAVAVPGGHFNG